MENIQGDMAFLGVHDIDLEAGITNPFSAEAELISVMIQRCRKKIILADHIKIGRVSLYKSECCFEDIDIIITDRHTEEKFINAFEKMEIEVMIAKDFGSYKRVSDNFEIKIF